MTSRLQSRVATPFHGKSALIADDDPIVVHALADRCKSLGMRVDTCGDGLRALLAIAKKAPDILILDLHLPDVDGFRVVERLADPKFAPLPVVLLTASSDQTSIDRCEALGALYLHKGAGALDELEDLMRNVFQEGGEEKAVNPAEASVPPRTRVLLVDDDPLVLRMLASGLQQHGLEVLTALNGMQGFWLVLKNHPDIVVTDYNMLEGSGHYLLSRIKSTPSTQRTPVIVFSARAMTDGQRSELQRDLRGRGNAAAFLIKPITPDSLAKEIARHVPKRSVNGAVV